MFALLHQHLVWNGSLLRAVRYWGTLCLILGTHLSLPFLQMRPSSQRPKESKNSSVVSTEWLTILGQISEFIAISDSPWQWKAMFCHWTIHEWSWPSGPNCYCCPWMVHQLFSDSQRWSLTIRGLCTTRCCKSVFPTPPIHEQSMNGP